MKLVGFPSLAEWRPECRAPQSRRLGIALACSVVLHVALMLSGGSCCNQNGASRFVAQMLSSEGYFHAPFLIVSLPQDRRLNGLTQDDGEVLAGRERLPADISADMKREIRTEGRDDPAGVSARESSPASRATSVAETQARRAELAESQRVNAEDAANRARRAAYLASALLDVAPRPLQDIQPDYPAAAGNQEGSVVLRLFISERGEVDELLVAHASPRGFFEEAALAAFAPARFSPGIQNGHAVKSQLAVEVQFVPFNRGADVSGRGY